MTKMEPVSFIAGLVAGGLLVWLIHEVKDAPTGYQDERGYGPVDLATVVRQAEKRGEERGELRGRLAGIHAMAGHPARIRVRGSAVGEEASVVELAEWAEARGRGDVA